MGPTYDITGIDPSLKSAILNSLRSSITKHGAKGERYARRYVVAKVAMESGNFRLKINEYQTIFMSLADCYDVLLAYQLDKLVEKNKTLGVFRELGD